MNTPPPTQAAVASALAQARLQAQAMPLELAAWLPVDLDAAYALQRDVSTALGAIGAWKVSALTAAAQRQMGVPQPIAAPLPARFVLHAHSGAPATVKLASLRQPLLECEFALQLAQDLPARGHAYSRAEVEAAIGALYIAVEVCDTRLPAGAPVLAQLADGFNNGAFVTALAQADWRAVDYAAQAIHLRFTPADDTAQAAEHAPAQQLASGNGRPVLDGDPVAALVLMANLQPQPYGGLRAGQIVTTGTCTGAVALPGPGVVDADFGALGRVRLHCI